MAASCDTRQTAISDLPPEILSHIFSYLPNILKVVRLVCSEWNELCNNIKVSGHERIAIRPSTTDESEKFFNNKIFLRNIYNLHVAHSARSDSVKTNYVSFFGKFGSHLRSLSLFSVGYDLNSPFLHLCKNLNALILHYCHSNIIRSFRYSDGSFVQTNIASLTIEYCDWSDEVMDSCFRICPHLRSFTLKSNFRRPFSLADDRLYSFKEGEERVFNRSDVFTFSCIHHAVSIRAANIVELNLIQIIGILPEQIERITSLPGLKLRELRICFADTITKKSICNIVTAQSELQKFSIRANIQTQLKGWADWIERCSKLIRLEIATHQAEKFVVDRGLLNALSSRVHLRELVLRTHAPSVISSDFGKSRATIDHLRRLELRLPNIDYNRILGKVSVNLNYLRLVDEDGISTATVEFISNRFTNLEVLKMDVAVACEKHYSKQLSLWNFGKLKILKLDAPKYKSCHANSLRRFKAPGLHRLKLRDFKIDATSLRDLVKNFPSMEYFQIFPTEFEINESDLRVVSDWKKLNYFNVSYAKCLQLHRCRENEEKFELFLKEVMLKKSFDYRR